MPTSYSRRRGSSSAVRPVAFSRKAAVSRARARSLLTSSAGLQVGDDGGHLLGLLAAGVVEADVGVALRASGGVPGGLAVPYQDEAPAARWSQRPRPEVTSAGIGITGQSRQSRSRA